MRAKVKVKDLILPKKLFFSTYHEIDKYFRYVKDTDKKWIVRIRNRDNNFYLTYKSSSVFGEGSWCEVEIKINKNEAQKMTSFFLSNEYIEEVKIIKTRKSCKYGGYEINIDKIKNLGDFIEVERMSTSDNVEKEKEKVLDFLIKLGVKEKNIINKGYVALMRDKKQNETT